MLRTLALIMGVAAAGLLVQTAARAARQEVPGLAAPPAPEQGAPGAAHTEKPRPPHTPQFHGLLGASEAEVTQRLGSPDLARAEGKGAMWTYRLHDCALFVFFRRHDPEGLRVSGAASGPRMRGRTPPPVNECLTEAFDRRAPTSAAPAPRAR